MGYVFDKYHRKKPEFTKSYLTNTYKSYMYDRTLSMFKYTNLPDTIPEEMFEYYLQHYGSCAITEVDGKLYAFHGNYGGYIDPYYRPTLYIVANPALKYSAQLEINKDCVFCINDKLWVGLEPLISRYAYLIAENLITLRVANIMLRIVALLSAPDDKTKAEAERYLSNLVEGKLGIIGENRFFEGVKMQSPPSNNGSYLTQFIELHQYLLGTFYSEIGLKANFNMKREAIMAEESSLNDDIIVALVETMYQCRLSNVERINKMYNTNIRVSFAGEWLRNDIERSLDLINASTQAGVGLEAVVGQLTPGSEEEGSTDGSSDSQLTNDNDSGDGSTEIGDGSDSNGDGSDNGSSEETGEVTSGDRVEGSRDWKVVDQSKPQTAEEDVVNFNTNQTTNQVLAELIQSAQEEKEKQEEKQEELAEQMKEGGDEDDVQKTTEDKEPVE